jgi:hypothetical protein
VYWKFIVLASIDGKHPVSFCNQPRAQEAICRSRKIAAITMNADQQGRHRGRLVARVPEGCIDSITVDSLDGEEAQRGSGRCVETLWQVRRPANEVILDTRCPFGTHICC